MGQRQLAPPLTRASPRRSGWKRTLAAMAIAAGDTLYR